MRFWNNLNSILSLALAILVVTLWSLPAAAQDTTVVTTVSIPWGLWLSVILPVGALVVLLLLAMLLKNLIPLLPPWLKPLASPEVQALLLGQAANALNAAVQAVEGATKNQELSVNVGNQVIAAAAQDFIDKTAPKLIDKMGGVDGAKKWVLSQAEDNGVILPVQSSTQGILSSPPVRSVSTPNPQ